MRFLSFLDKLDSVRFSQIVIVMLGRNAGHLAYNA
jgi:hypothetical protein